MAGIGFAAVPSIALQLVGIQSVLQRMGLAGHGWQKDLPLIIAFAILAAYTYTSGLRAPALIAFIKDILIYVVVIMAVIYIPTRLGGYGHIFDAAQAHFALPKVKKAGGAFITPPGGGVAYWTLAPGSAFARFFHRWALFLGWLAGMVTGTLMAYAVPKPVKHQHHFGGSVYAWHYFGLRFKAYHGLIAVVINLIVVVVASVVLNLLRVVKGQDRTAAADFEASAGMEVPPTMGIAS